MIAHILQIHACGISSAATDYNIIILKKQTKQNKRIWSLREASFIS